MQLSLNNLCDVTNSYYTPAGRRLDGLDGGEGKVAGTPCSAL